MDIFSFIQDQVLGMHWLNDLIDQLLNAIGIDTVTSNVGNTLQFFIYDVIKIVILLCVLIFIISYIQSYFPPEKTKRILGNFHGIGANIISALIGTVTPFCSCSSIPLFIGFTSAGLPLGVTFSFLISSPLVDLGSLLLLIGIFGYKIAVAYVILGLILAVIGGTIIDKLHMEDYIQDYIKEIQNVQVDETAMTQKEKIKYAWGEMIAIFKRVTPYILLGVGIGAFIHNWIPTEYIQLLLGKDNPFSVILATIIGIPMYADIFGAIPIAESLLMKQAGLGTVLSFMMGVTALSLPSMVMLKNAVKNRLLFVFIAIVTIGIFIIGYTFNALQFLFI